MKSASCISPNFLERVAEPQSPFHSDYLSYLRNEITREELIARLPHVALLEFFACGALINTGLQRGVRARLTAKAV
jgi:hypothetical protein